MTILEHLLASMRPRHWTKNLTVLVALIFTDFPAHAGSAGRAAALAALFCAASGAIYLVNDVADRERDRHHDVKRLRPIASGELPVRTALAAAVLLITVSLAASHLIAAGAGMLLAAYVALSISYTLFFKRLLIVDAVVIGAGFAIRIASGAAAIGAAPDGWIMAFAALLTIFFVLAKRRRDLLILGDRGILPAGYTQRLLGSLLPATAAAAAACYCPCAVDHALLWSAPFLFYGLFRYIGYTFIQQ
jgi:4-hydroxybenzoate polyprenyltransferase